jgi:3-methyladenine DNA glycosylase AlkD
MSELNSFLQEFKQLANPAKNKMMQRFFKTEKGQYGHGDVFLGITVPLQRKLAKKYSGLSLFDLQKLLKSKVHEHRLTALIILVRQFQKASQVEKEQIFKFYLANAKRINNWDLVDSSAPQIVGRYLLDKNKSILYLLAKSENLWEKRIAILSTQAFIRAGKFEDTFKIAKILMADNHDLIHKAVGWMIREVGNKSLVAEEKFLKRNYKKFHRTALRYAIEKFPEVRRKKYLSGKI